MSKRNKKKNTDVNTEANAQAPACVETNEEKETEEMTEKKGFITVVVDGAKKVVKSTPFKVVAGAAIGVGATLGALVLARRSSEDDFYDDDFIDDSVEKTSNTEESAPAETEEN